MTAARGRCPHAVHGPACPDPAACPSPGEQVRALQERAGAQSVDAAETPGGAQSVDACRCLPGRWHRRGCPSTPDAVHQAADDAAGAWDRIRGAMRDRTAGARPVTPVAPVDVLAGPPSTPEPSAATGEPAAAPVDVWRATARAVRALAAVHAAREIRGPAPAGDLAPPAAWFAPAGTAAPSTLPPGPSSPWRPVDASALPALTELVRGAPVLVDLVADAPPEELQRARLAGEPLQRVDPLSDPRTAAGPFAGPVTLGTPWHAAMDAHGRPDGPADAGPGKAPRARTLAEHIAGQLADAITRAPLDGSLVAVRPDGRTVDQERADVLAGPSFARGTFRPNVAERRPWTRERLTELADRVREAGTWTVARYAHLDAWQDGPAVGPLPRLSSFVDLAAGPQDQAADDGPQEAAQEAGPITGRPLDVIRARIRADLDDEPQDEPTRAPCPLDPAAGPCRCTPGSVRCRAPRDADGWPTGIRDAILAADPGPWTDPGPRAPQEPQEAPAGPFPPDASELYPAGEAAADLAERVAALRARILAGPVGPFRGPLVHHTAQAAPGTSWHVWQDRHGTAGRSASALVSPPIGPDAHPVHAPTSPRIRWDELPPITAPRGGIRYGATDRPQEAPPVPDHTEHHAPGCPGGHPLGTLCNRPRSAPRTPQEAPEEPHAAVRAHLADNLDGPPVTGPYEAGPPVHGGLGCHAAHYPGTACRETPQELPDHERATSPNRHRVTLAAGRVFLAPVGTMPPHEAPEPSPMAPYADTGPENAATGTPWQHLGELAPGTGLSFELPDDVDPGPWHGPVGPVLTGQSASVSFHLANLAPGALRLLFGKRPSDLAAERSRARSRTALRALRRNAAHIRRTTPDRRP